MSSSSDKEKQIGNTVSVGDTVAYSSRFLRSIGEYTGDMPFARGKVTELVSVCQTLLARIDWTTPDLPSSVNVANLSRVKDGVVMEVD